MTINSRKGRSLAIADNRASEIGLDWDPKILVSLDVKLGELFDDRDMRQILGDLAPEVEAPEPKLDQALELAKKWRTNIGQLWNIGHIDSFAEIVPKKSPGRAFGDLGKFMNPKKLMGEEFLRLSTNSIISQIQLGSLP